MQLCSMEPRIFGVDGRGRGDCKGPGKAKTSWEQRWEAKQTRLSKFLLGTMVFLLFIFWWICFLFLRKRWVKYIYIYFFFRLQQEKTDKNKKSLFGSLIEHLQEVLHRVTKPSVLFGGFMWSVCCRGCSTIILPVQKGLAERSCYRRGKVSK